MSRTLFWILISTAIAGAAAATSGALWHAATQSRESAAKTDGGNARVGGDKAVTIADIRNRELSIESQCGATWDAQQVELYNGAIGPTQAFVARHESRVGYHVDVGCSGTLISDDLFLSAGHCSYAVGHRVRFNYQNAPNGIARPTSDFVVSQVVEQESSNAWDYAIVRLSGSPGREFGHANIAAIDPPAGSRLTIIGHPATRPKEIHAGPLLDYSSSVGTNWFRHQADTVGGNSGSGMLNDRGELIGVHTNAGCNTSGSIEGNSAMRMSQLVNRSPALQALTRNRLLWRNTNGDISLWRTNAVGDFLDNREYAVGTVWLPLSMSDNRVLWRHNDGTAAYWVLNETGDITSAVTLGPFAGWTPINHANDRILWRHTDGRVSLWRVDANGNFVDGREYGPYNGWTPFYYGNNRLLWRTAAGQLWIWRLDDAGNYLSDVSYGPYSGWTPQSYSNGELFWSNTSGQSAFWSLNRSGGILSSIANGPYANWTPIALGDRKLLWRNANGSASYWTTDSDGNFVDARVHGPYANWVPMLSARAMR